MNTVLSLPVGNPFGLREHQGRFAPGVSIRSADRVWRIRGTVLATDHAESWIECLLQADGAPTNVIPLNGSATQTWLAVEAHHGRARCTLWQRTTATQAGIDFQQAALNGIPLTESERGHARYQAAGTFGHVQVPSEGVLEYVEYTHAEGRTACERFAPHLPWLIGSGTGQALTAEVADDCPPG